MQQILPIFPDNTKMVNYQIGFKKMDDFVYFKIICYRSESAIANLLAGYYRKSTNEIRALVKSIIFAKADLYPDYQTKTLTVRLNTLATPRDNMAIREIYQTLNDYEAIFPGTDLKLIYK